MRFSHILFDIDGTVADTRESMRAGYAHVCSTLGLSEDNPRRIDAFVGTRSTQIFNRYHGLQGEDFEHAVAIYYDYFLSGGIRLAQLYPGMRDLLNGLHAAGVPMAVATARTRKQLDALMDTLDLYPYFDFICATQSHHQTADKAEEARACVQHFQAPAQQMVMVGDRKYDILGAHAAGMQAIGITHGFGSEQELREAGAEHIVHNTAQLHTLLWETSI